MQQYCANYYILAASLHIFRDLGGLLPMLMSAKMENLVHYSQPNEK